MNVVELKRLASGLGITGSTKMRKDDLVAAITARQVGSAPRSETGAQPTSRPEAERAPEPVETPADPPKHVEQRSDSTTRERTSVAPEVAQDATRTTTDTTTDTTTGTTTGTTTDTTMRSERSERTQQRPQQERQTDRQADRRQDRQQDRQSDRQPDRQANRQGQTAPSSAPPAQPTSSSAAQNSDDDDETRGGRRRSRQRSRDRKRSRGTTGTTQEYEPELQITDDDILVPVAGILDVLDNYAFVRTSGYLPGPNDVYVPLGLVKRYSLRKGDAVTGSIKAPREGEQPQNGTGGRQKFNALVRLDTINGLPPDQTRTRVDFGKLTPLYPQERLRLETETSNLTTRVIDLVAPIGKGQRGLIVAPSEAGKTMVLQSIANAITQNNPECHLMVVLVDERPEEVTEMQRAVKGEVIASTFDRPADDHTSVAELSIERAKRLVELGHDVVVLLDSITKLGRAYNLAAPASGRVLSGGVDSAALYPPKKFFGAARNIENGGSLTIIATALVDTDSKMDEVIFEEFRGTGNMELRLGQDLANRRIFPAVEVNASGTRREELLLGPEELKIMYKLRRVLGALEPQPALELLLDRIRRTRTNIEFLRQVQMSSSSKLDADD
ncbi:MAG TPA: transcription termination factor Rho [Lapillicoccus sp.]|uniref:transcription termination factor Rho n=1 Tax=Lapillicoccus sp. TaxID=1909287 RepID=UPI002F93362F